MAIGPNLKWIKDNYKKIKYLNYFIFFICIFISFYLIKKTSSEILFTSF